MSISLIPGEFSAFTIAIAVISGFIVFFGYVSMFLKERLFLSEAFIAVIVGIIAGPLVANGINPYNWEGNDEITKQLTRCVIAVQVMAVGIELPKHYLQKDWQTVLMLLLPVMLFMWLISGMIIFFLIPPINFLESLVIAACVCPTDPILANSVVKGRFADKHVPVHIRNALSAESGANDGMGFPFLFLAIFLLGEDHVGKAVAKWIYETCLFQIALSCVIGVVVGYIARKALQWSNTKKIIDKPSFLSFAIALALFLMSMTGFSGSDDVLACFAAGNAFSWDDWFRQETKEAHFQDVIDMLLNISIFVYIGALIPWNEFNDPDLGLTPWRLVLMAILILLFRRLPAVLLLKRAIPAMKTYREALFSGWFGPMGVGAVFLSKIAREEMLQVYPTPAGQAEPLSIRLINPIVLFIVLSSVFVHGTTIPLFKLGRKIQTRTLSHTSAKSTSKTVSKWYNDKFGGGKSKSMDVLITERNTLRNITHRPTLIMGGNNDTTMQDGYAIDMYDYSDIREEDLLPDDRVRQSANNSAFEAQNIRFVEPVVSRTNIPITKSHQAYEGKRRQSIVDQVLAWFHKRSSLKPAEVAAAERQHHEDQASDSAVTTAADDATAKDSNTVQSSPSPSSVQVFDERNKLVVEDGHGRGTAFVIDKSMPDWRDRVKLKIRQLQEMLQETTEQDDDDDLKEGDLTFHSSSKTSSSPSTTH